MAKALDGEAFHYQALADVGAQHDWWDDGQGPQEVVPTEQALPHQRQDGDGDDQVVVDGDGGIPLSSPAKGAAAGALACRGRQPRMSKSAATITTTLASSLM